ncbi:hypothetical protein QTP86_007787 [Hemibagrus guttatus]|nr:hypothetical protein QTP86_007787 [Hemibagrus guttatus]
MFYRGTIESILSSCITAWFGNCTVLDRKSLQRIVTTAENIIGVSLPSITDMYTTCCILKANNIVDDPTHSSHTLFILLPSGKSEQNQYLIPKKNMTVLRNMRNPCWQAQSLPNPPGIGDGFSRERSIHVQCGRRFTGWSPVGDSELESCEVEPLGLTGIQAFRPTEILQIAVIGDDHKISAGSWRRLPSPRMGRRGQGDMGAVVKLRLSFMNASQAGEHSSYVGYMFFPRLGVNEDIIYVCYNELIEHVPEYFVDQGLEYCGGIGKSVGHDQILIMTLGCVEGGFPFVPVLDSDEIVGAAEIEFGEYADPL